MCEIGFFFVVATALVSEFSDQRRGHAEVAGRRVLSWFGVRRGVGSFVLVEIGVMILGEMGGVPAARVSGTTAVLTPLDWGGLAGAAVLVIASVGFAWFGWLVAPMRRLAIIATGWGGSGFGGLSIGLGGGLPLLRLGEGLGGVDESQPSLFGLEDIELPSAMCDMI